MRIQIQVNGKWTDVDFDSTPTEADIDAAAKAIAKGQRQGVAPARATRFQQGVNSGAAEVIGKYVKQLGFTPAHGFATSGHVRNSAHYEGRALDVDVSGKSESDIAYLRQFAKDSGLKFLDERTQPPGEKEWTGPHIHLEMPRDWSAPDTESDTDVNVQPVKPKAQPAAPKAMPSGPAIKGDTQILFKNPIGLPGSPSLDDSANQYPPGTTWGNPQIPVPGAPAPKTPATPLPAKPRMAPWQPDPAVVGATRRIAGLHQRKASVIQEMQGINRLSQMGLELDPEHQARLAKLHQALGQIDGAIRSLQDSSVARVIHRFQLGNQLPPASIPGVPSFQYQDVIRALGGQDQIQSMREADQASFAAHSHGKLSPEELRQLAIERDAEIERLREETPYASPQYVGSEADIENQYMRGQHSPGIAERAAEEGSPNQRALAQERMYREDAAEAHRQFLAANPVAAMHERKADVNRATEWVADNLFKPWMPSGPIGDFIAGNAAYGLLFPAQMGAELDTLKTPGVGAGETLGAAANLLAAALLHESHNLPIVERFKAAAKSAAKSALDKVAPNLGKTFSVKGRNEAFSAALARLNLSPEQQARYGKAYVEELSRNLGVPAPTWRKPPDQGKRTARRGRKAKEAQAPEAVEPTPEPKAEGQTLSIERGEVPVSEIGVHPELQYKSSEVTNKASGTGPQFQGVDVYDKAQGGTWTVWEDKDGKLYALNSHHRRELANRASRFVDSSIRPGEQVDVPRQVPVRILREADGWTVQKARVYGAMENIRDGKGTAFDAVNVMRESGFTPENWRQQFKDAGVSLASKLSRNIQGLMNLPASALDYVKTGRVPEDVVAGVGSAEGLSEAEQKAVLDMLARKTAEGDGPKTFQEGQNIGRRARSKLMQKVATGSLFEGDTEFQNSMDNLDTEASLIQRVKNLVQQRRKELLAPVGSQELEGEHFDREQRQTLASQMGESHRNAKDRIDFVFDHDHELSQRLDAVAREVVNGKKDIKTAAEELYAPATERASGDLGRYLRENEPGAKEETNPVAPGEAAAPVPPKPDVLTPAQPRMEGLEPTEPSDLNLTPPPEPPKPKEKGQQGTLEMPEEGGEPPKPKEEGQQGTLEMPEEGGEPPKPKEEGQQGTLEMPEEGGEPPRTTGLSNRTLAEREQKGDIEEAPEPYTGQTKQQLRAEGRQFTDLDEADKLGAQVAHGMAESRENFNKAVEADRLFQRAIDAADKKVHDLEKSGASKEEIQAARQEAQSLRDRHERFLHNIQGGKGEWSNIGRTLDSEANYDTGDLESVRRAAQKAKGDKPLTPQESKELEKLVGDANEADAAVQKRAEEVKAQNAKPRRAYKTRDPKEIWSDIKAEFQRWKREPGGVKPGIGGSVSHPLTPKMQKLIGELVDAVIDHGATDIHNLYATVSDRLKELGVGISQEEMSKYYDNYRTSKIAGRKRAVSAARRLKTIVQLHGKIAKAAEGIIDPKNPKSPPDAEIAGLRKQLSAAIKGSEPGIQRRYADAVDRLLQAIERAKKNEKKASPNDPYAGFSKEQIENLKNLAGEASRIRQGNSLRAAIAGLDELLALPDKEFKERWAEIRERMKPGEGMKTDPELRRLAEIKRDKQQIVRARVEKFRPRTAAEKEATWVKGAVLTSIPAVMRLLAASFQGHVTGPMEDAVSQLFKKMSAGEGKTLGDMAPEEVADLTSTYLRARGPFTKKALKAGWMEVMRGETEGEKTLPGRIESYRNSFPDFPRRVHGAEKVWARKTGEYDRAMHLILKRFAEEGRDVNDPGVIADAQVRAERAANDAILLGHNAVAEHISSSIQNLLKSEHVSNQFVGMLLNQIMPLVKVPANFLKFGADYVGFGIGRGEVLRRLALKRGAEQSAAILDRIRIAQEAGKPFSAETEAEIRDDAKAARTISNEDAAEILRAYKRGGVGLVLSMIGFAQPKWLQAGGFYPVGLKQDPDALDKPSVAPEHVRLFGRDLSPLIVHGPAMVPIQFWATIRHAIDRGETFGQGLERAMGGLANLGPGAYQLEHASESFQKGKVGAVLGDYLGEMSPGAAKGVAKAQDLDEKSNPFIYGSLGIGDVAPREDEGFLSTIQGGIPSNVFGINVPFGRKSLPLKGVPEKGENEDDWQYYRRLTLKQAYTLYKFGGDKVPHRKWLQDNLAAKLRSASKSDIRELIIAGHKSDKEQEKLRQRNDRKQVRLQKLADEVDRGKVPNLNPFGEGD